MVNMGGCLTSDYQDPNTLFNKPNTDPPENGSAKYTPLPNGTVDSKAGVVTPCTKGSILRGDIFMYQEAKAKRQRLLRAHEKKRDRLAQIKSSEAMDENERLSLRSSTQSRTTSRQTSPRIGARKNAVHPSDVSDGSGSEAASSSSKNGRQAWSPSSVDGFIPEVVEEPIRLLDRETVRHSEAVNGNNVPSRELPNSALPNQCSYNSDKTECNELGGVNTSDKLDPNELDNVSGVSAARGKTRRKGGKSKSSERTVLSDTIFSNA